MTTNPHDDEIELDPKILKFGMSKAEVDKLKNKAKERKKMNKGWNPGH